MAPLMQFGDQHHGRRPSRRHIAAVLLRVTAIVVGTLIGVTVLLTIGAILLRP